MIICTGIDIVNIARFNPEQLSPRFYERVYSPEELIQASGIALKLAERFAIKEAVMKSLSIGIQDGAWFRQIETDFHIKQGWQIALSGKAAKTSKKLGIGTIKINVSSSRILSVAVAFGIPR